MGFVFPWIQGILVNADSPFTFFFFYQLKGGKQVFALREREREERRDQREERAREREVSLRQKRGYERAWINSERGERERERGERGRKKRERSEGFSPLFSCWRGRSPPFQCTLWENVLQFFSLQAKNIILEMSNILHLFKYQNYRWTPYWINSDTQHIIFPLVIRKNIFFESKPRLKPSDTSLLEACSKWEIYEPYDSLGIVLAFYYFEIQT